MLSVLLAAAGTRPPPLSSVWQNVLTDFAHLTEPAALATFASVLVIDLVLAGDNAIVVGALAAGLPAAERRRVILIGIGAALVLRIVFALAATWLMGIVGLVFAGGLLLLWVSWKFWREIRSSGHHADDMRQGIAASRSFAAAAWAVAIADVSMSLDNVLAVAGAAREHPGILVVGLMLSVALMGLAANVIAQVIDRYRWIAYVGLSVILLVALRMIYEGWVGTDDAAGLASLLG